MVVDGKSIATDILQAVASEVKKLGQKPRLVAITCAPNFETKKYLEIKTKRAWAVEIELLVEELPADVTTELFVEKITALAGTVDGIVVQLPLPTTIDREVVLAAVPADKDPDGFKYGEESMACLSPVVGAIDEISKKYKITWSDKKVLILGNGRLVGKPATAYAKMRGAQVQVISKDNYTEVLLKEADIIVSGIGQPNFIQPEMVKDGVVIFDAGTSEEGGVLTGDVDPAVAEVASLLTPVPGGIGPITIAYLLRNLVKLVRQNK